MKYAKPLKQSYFAPTHHQVFRMEWEANFSKATSELKKLGKAGYLVDDALQRGALMESQAKKLAEALQRQGFEVRLIPIASWQGEKVVFLAARPQKPAQEKPKEKFERDDHTDFILKRFLAVTHKSVDPQELQKFWNTGTVVSPNGTLLFCHRDSSQAKNARAKKTFLFHIPNAFDFWKALNRARLGGKPPFERFEVAPNFTISIDEFQKALDVFEYAALDAYIDENSGHFMLVDKKGNVMFIRERLVPVNSITYEELKKLFGTNLNL